MLTSKECSVSRTMYHNGAETSEDAALNIAPARSPKPRLWSISEVRPPATDDTPPATALINELQTENCLVWSGKRDCMAEGSHTRMPKPAQKRSPEARSSQRAAFDARASAVLVKTAPSASGIPLSMSRSMPAVPSSPRPAPAPAPAPLTVPPPEWAAEPPPGSWAGGGRRRSAGTNASKESAMLTNPKMAEQSRQPRCSSNASPKDAMPVPR
mmetsp:Transcript_32721/g.90345  ORF Transcript_32721/g.90345 Transcript_32721/m.90345 type:complete len:213 (-) Transcript_32721:707-1345(-)